MVEDFSSNESREFSNFQPNRWLQAGSIHPKPRYGVMDVTSVNPAALMATNGCVNTTF